MQRLKWDGVTHSTEVLKALLFFVDGEDKEYAITTSYGDFGKYLQKKYKNMGKGNGGVHSVFGWAKNVEVTLCKLNVRYEITWNKAAKLIHKHLKGDKK